MPSAASAVTWFDGIQLAMSLERFMNLREATGGEKRPLREGDDPKSWAAVTSELSGAIC
jgi:hypothetical protein